MPHLKFSPKAPKLVEPALPHSQVGKEHFWEMASNMVNSFSGSRMAIGDFNSISNIGEILCLIRVQSTWGSMVIYSHGQIEEMV